MSVKILWDDSVQAYRVATPYSPNFVELLKQQIPIAHRVWDPQMKIWTIAEQFGDPVKKLCEAVFAAPNVTFVSKAEAQRIAALRAAQAQQAQSNQYYGYVPPRQPQPQRGDPLDSVMLTFCKMLPYDAAKAAYRKAAMELHPDRNGGNAISMQVLNTSWSRIEKEFYQK